MSIESYQRNVQNHLKELAKLQQEKSREAALASDQFKRGNSASASASTTSSTLTRQSKLRDAQRYQDAAVRHQKRFADIESKISREYDRLNNAQKRLTAAQYQEDRRRIQDQERAAREHESRMKAIAGKLTHHAQLHEVTMTAIEKLQELPEQITVLFLAANPLNQEQLRLDEEVRAIGEMIRKSKHRDAVRLESRWAVRPLDVLQAINEFQPRIVHFSGHGSNQDEIVFQDNAGQAKFVSKEAIVQTMAAASGDIQLVFFNTCYSRGQAEAVLQHVSAAIGMNASIGDEAARVFAAQFYSAIGFGQPVGRAFQQAKAALMLEGILEESTPELFISVKFNVDNLILVRPAGNSDSRKA